MFVWWRKLSRNASISGALAVLATSPAPAELFLCECGLAAESGESVGKWAARGITKLDLRDNSSWGSDGLDRLIR